MTRAPLDPNKELKFINHVRRLRCPKYFIRLRALIKKEFLQIARDPSALLIAFMFPIILLLIYGYGVNLDSNEVKMGVVMEERTPDSVSLSLAFQNSKFLDVTMANDRREIVEDVVGGRLRGLVVIPQNFKIQQELVSKNPLIQVIGDGSETNTASFVQDYAKGVIDVWLAHQREDLGISAQNSVIKTQPRFWYNQELKSRNFLVPGSIAIIMTLIGTLLTALVIAREWERGTMEALMATPVSIQEILLGKLIPYFILGMGSMMLCWSIATFYYDVPFRGSFLALICATGVFLFSALGQGLLISTATKDQFAAAQVAITSAYLPAFMLSGFIFEISTMPLPIQGITYFFSARYFVTILQTLFLAGNIWYLIIPSLLGMAMMATFFFTLTLRKTKKRLDI